MQDHAPELVHLPEQQSYLTVDGLGRELNIGRSKAYELVGRPDFPAVRIGKLIRIPRHALERWVEQQISQGEDF